MGHAVCIRDPSLVLIFSVCHLIIGLCVLGVAWFSMNNREAMIRAMITNHRSIGAFICLCAAWQLQKVFAIPTGHFRIDVIVTATIAGGWAAMLWFVIRETRGR